MDTDLILKQLSHASIFLRKSRTIRFLANPWKTLYPKFLKLTHLSYEVEARTFWGKKINVILPEGVSTSIWHCGCFEEEVCYFMLKFLSPGMTFFDIGAHFGFFTLLGSYLVGKEGKVLSFEPTPSTYQQLKKNVAHNSNVEIYNYAAFDKSAEIKFYDYGLRNSAYNSMFRIRRRDTLLSRGNEIIVKARKTDTLVEEKQLKRINLVKIDTESSELYVLKGMINSLKKFRPYIIMEVGDFKVKGIPKSAEVVTYLQGIGYSSYTIKNGCLRKHNQKTFYGYDNLFFMPKN